MSAFISIECIDPNHIARDAAKRREAITEVIRDLELGHRVGDASFVGHVQRRDGWSHDGGPGAKALADVFNENYLPVCEKLDIADGMGELPL